MPTFRNREEEKNLHKRLRREGKSGRWYNRNQVKKGFKEGRDSF